MIIKNSKNPEEIRKRMVERYYELGENASATAREFNTKRQTVSFWIERYKREGEDGLKNASRAPKHVPHKTPKEIEEKIVAIAQAKKCRIGQDRIQDELSAYGLHRSTSTINRIMHEHDLIKKRIRKYKKKKQVKEYKKKLKALRHLQVDVKDLIDIPNIYALIDAGIIPRYQYSARDTITGTAYIAYGYSHDLINSVRFVQAVFEHLRQFGIHSSEITIQTDNGSEFIGNITAKEPSAFERLIESVYYGKHKTIPLGKKEWQGVVESFHGRIEDEHYDIESYRSLSEFLSKTWSFMLYWNLKRKNLEKKKTPFQLIKEKCRILDPAIGNFQPFVLDEMNTWPGIHYQEKSVPYVADEVTYLTS